MQSVDSADEFIGATLVPVCLLCLGTMQRHSGAVTPLQPALEPHGRHNDPTRGDANAELFREPASRRTADAEASWSSATE